MQTLTTLKQTDDRKIRLLKQTAVQAPWELFLLPISAFPTPEEEIELARKFFQRLTPMIENEWKLPMEIFIQSTQAHVGDGATRLFDHGSEWKTKLGLGVWPDRLPPTLWRREDFQNLDVGEMPRRLMYSTLRV